MKYTDWLIDRQRKTATSGCRCLEFPYAPSLGRLRFVRLYLPLDDGRVLPKAFYLVILAFFLPEDMHHDIHVIEEYPTLVLFPLPADGFNALCGQPFLYCFQDASDLPIGIAAADDEIIGEDKDVPHVKHQDIVGFFVRGGLSRRDGYLPAVRRYTPPPLLHFHLCRGYSR